jgi:hypothetical protein
MITTLYGYKIPEANDKGPVVFPGMEDNIQRINDHDHKGSNSKPLDPASVPATEQTVLAAGWSLVANGIYKQTVTVPSGLNFDLTLREFRLSDGSQFFPTLNRLSTLQYEIFINDPTQTLKVLYK